MENSESHVAKEMILDRYFTPSFTPIIHNPTFINHKQSFPLLDTYFGIFVQLIVKDSKEIDSGCLRVQKNKKAIKSTFKA